MVILHNLLQENKYLFVYPFTAKQAEMKKSEKTFLQIFIYFQLLGMFRRWKRRCVKAYSSEDDQRDKTHCCLIFFMLFMDL